MLRYILLILTSSACVRLKRIENDIECVQFTCWKAGALAPVESNKYSQSIKKIVGRLFRK